VALDGYGRLRAVAVAPDGALWVMTNNTDGRGSPRDGDDQILRFAPV
jgi:glucose/arabinose dehydrogenase